MLGNAQSKTVGVLVVAVAGLTVLGLLFAGQGIGVGAIAGTQNVVSEGGGAATQSMPPQADAGANRTATERTSLTLSAENSSMPDGEGLSYSWTQTGGPAVTLADDETASPTFTTPGVETATAITFEVTVTNSDGATDTDSVTIIVQPLVSESESTNITSQDRIVMGAESVQLSVSAAVAPDDEELSYSWTQTGGPGVNMTDADTSSPSFSAPSIRNSTTLTFEVSVADGTATDTVNITVYPGNEPPEADITGLQVVSGTHSTTLGAGLSTDPEGDSLSYEWNQTAGPDAETGTTSAAALTLTAPNVGESTNLTFEVTVSDGEGGTDTEAVNVTVTPYSSDDPSSSSESSSNDPPTAVTGADRSVTAGTTVSLTGSESWDPNGDDMSYTWDQTAGADVTLEHNSPASFTAPDVDEVTTLTFELTVSDRYGATDTDTVDITVEPAEETDETTFYQVDFVEGSPLASLGPADSDNFYSDQQRLVQYIWGSDEDEVTGQGQSSTLNESTDQCIESEDITVSGDVASVTFTIADSCSMEVSLVSYTMPNSEFRRTTASQQEFYDSTTVSLGSGTHTITVDLPA